MALCIAGDIPATCGATSTAILLLDSMARIRTTISVGLADFSRSTCCLTGLLHRTGDHFHV